MSPSTDEHAAVEHWRFDPFCPPDWRWLDAQRIVDGQQPLWSSTEPGVQHAVSFLRAGGDGMSDGCEHRLADAVAARRIYEAGGVLKWQIEARILARQDDAMISERLRLAPTVVRSYESWFFGVREFLGASGYIHSQVIGARTLFGFRDDHLPQFWMWLGYECGPVMLDYFVDCLLGAIEGGLPARLSTYLAPDSGVPLCAAAFVALRMLPPGLVEAHMFGSDGGMDLTSVAHPGSGTGKGLQEAQQYVLDLARRYLGGKLRWKRAKPAAGGRRSAGASRRGDVERDARGPAATLDDNERGEGDTDDRRDGDWREESGRVGVDRTSRPGRQGRFEAGGERGT